jgi:hypothetical protein
MAKILVSIISYKEIELENTVKSCFNNAKNKQNLLFSIVDENKENQYADLSFVPKNQILYKKYDLSEYRGILWARNETNNHNFEYDYILYICAHTQFEQDWDIICLEEYEKALKKNNSYKTVLTYCGPDYEIDKSYSVKKYNTELNINNNLYVEKFDTKKFIPGFWFPRANNVPQGEGTFYLVFCK